ncbi:hypothetical protein ACTPOK_06535 [Streptomyces inhibens]|uniref:hypothetical protein n=1 Tax=Streptomyces inhibens TaxID=2293571 RepID=UPI00402A72EB
MTENTGISYVKGDATAPQGKGVKVIAHIPGEPLITERLTRHGIPVTVYDR